MCQELGVCVVNYDMRDYHYWMESCCEFWQERAVRSGTPLIPGCVCCELRYERLPLLDGTLL